MKVLQRRKRPRKLNYIPRAADVHAHRRFAFNCEIVKRGEMKDSRRLLFREFEIRGAETETRLSDVAFDDAKICGRTVRELSNATDLVTRAVQPRRLHEQYEAALFPRQT